MARRSSCQTFGETHCLSLLERQTDAHVETQAWFRHAQHWEWLFPCSSLISRKTIRRLWRKTVRSLISRKTVRRSWMVLDHNLTVQTWTPDFISPTTKIEKTMVWIHFSGLSLFYYDESVFLALAASVGKPIRAYINTKDVR